MGHPAHNSPQHGSKDCRRHAQLLQPHRALPPDVCVPVIDLAEANVFGQAWGTSVDVSTLASTVAPQIFALSIFPYAGFLYCLTRSGKTPPLALFGAHGLPHVPRRTLRTGFYFLLAFVFVTIPAGIYAKQAYGTTLANVDWLHGGAESLLTVTNLLVRMHTEMGLFTESRPPGGAGLSQGHS